MKKWFSALLILAILGFSNLALAANSTFSDVPAKHWAYDAISKLAKAGIVSGYGDNTFRGDRTMTRYEMATIVANAITKEDNANAENKALIEKLAAEFSDELKSLGVRVQALEAKEESRLKISGVGVFDYEWVKNARPWPVALGGSLSPDGTSKSETRTLAVFNLDEKFDKDSYFHAELAGEVMGGRAVDSSSVKFQTAHYASKAGGIEWAVGRFTPYIGKGLLYYVPYNDGIRVSFGTDVKTTLYSVKFSDRTWTLADVGYKASSNTNLFLSYVNDKVNTGYDPIFANKDYYNSTALGVEYTGLKNLTLTAEFGQNRAADAKAANDGSVPRGMYIRAKYKGANPAAIGSAGFWVMYKNAQNGFDLVNRSSRNEFAGPYNWSAGSCGGALNDLQGFEYGFEVTVAPHAILMVRYDDLSAKKVPGGLLYDEYGAAFNQITQKEQKYFLSQLVWFF